MIEYILYVSFFASFIFLMIGVYQYIQRPRSDAIIKKYKRKKGKDPFRIVYLLFKHTPGLKGIFVQTQRAVRLLYPVDAMSQNKIISKMLGMSSLFALGFAVLGCILSFGQFLIYGVSLVLACCVFDKQINDYLQKANDVILDEFFDFLSKLRNHYHEMPNLILAFRLAKDESMPVIQPHLEVVYDILAAPDMRMRIDSYVGCEPNVYISLFLAVSASVMENGDRKDEKGNSNYLQNLQFIKEQVKSEIKNRKNIKKKFSGAAWWCIVPMLAAKGFSMFTVYSLEDTQSLFDGVYGTAGLCILTLLAVVSYKMVMLLKNGSSEQRVDENFYSRIARNRVLNVWLNRIINRRYTLYMRYKDIMEGINDFSGVKGLIVKRFIFAFIAFVLSVFIFVSSVITLSATAFNGFRADVEESVEPSEEYKQTIAEYAEYKARNYYRAGIEPSDIELEQAIQEDKVVTRYTDIRLVKASIVKHLEQKMGAYYKWYYLIISLFAAVFGYYLPVLMLQQKKSVIDERRGNEVIQFQSLILILRNMAGTNLSMLLEWMERFSVCFRNSIIRCRMNLPAGQIKALDEMQSCESFEPFKDLCEQLKAIDRVGIVKAFDVLESDREYNKELLDEANEERLNWKSFLASMWQQVTLYSVLLYGFILPALIFGVNFYIETKKGL